MLISAGGKWVSFIVGSVTAFQNVSKVGERWLFNLRISLQPKRTLFGDKFSEWDA